MQQLLTLTMMVKLLLCAFMYVRTANEDTWLPELHAGSDSQTPPIQSSTAFNELVTYQLKVQHSVVQQHFAVCNWRCILISKDSRARAKLY